MAAVTFATSDLAAASAAVTVATSDLAAASLSTMSA
jgi:hypothetical protein